MIDLFKFGDHLPLGHIPHTKLIHVFLNEKGHRPNTNYIEIDLTFNTGVAMLS